MTVSLYHGDCLDILRTLDAGSVDAVVTDPPYGVDYVLNWQRENGMDRFGAMNGNDGFDPNPFLKYKTVLLFGANNFADRLPVGNWLVWDKRLSARADKMFGSPFEMAWYRSSTTKRTCWMIRLLHGGGR